MLELEHREPIRHQLSSGFPEPVLREASRAVLSEDLFEGRREVPGLTIDGPFSKDLDDAIWLEKQGKGYLVKVSIADVAALVPDDSSTNAEAYRKGVTRYYSNGNDPMIPRPLSEGLLTLSEGQKRLTMTASIPLDEQFSPGEVLIEPTVTTSRKRFSYGEVDTAIDDPEHPLSPVFQEYYKVASELLRKRRDNGALAIYDIFSGIATTEEGLILPLTEETRHKSNVIIQEFMILANQAVARYFAENDIPALFRNHVAKAIAPDREILLQDMQNAVDYPTTFNLSTLTQRVAVSLNKAYYSPKLAGHFGLNIPAYVHFTSPIRRYADLVNQRILAAVLKGDPSPYSQEDLEQIGQHLNEVETGLKNRKSIALKDRAFAAARNSVDANKIANLSPSDFTTLVKVVARENRMTAEVSEVMTQRLKDGKLAPNDIYLLLLEAPKGDENWVSLHAEILNWLKENPAYAVSIAVMASQSKDWPAIEYVSQHKGPDHARYFISRAKIILNDEEIVSEEVVGTNQKVSQQLATVSLLAKITGQPGAVDFTEHGKEKVIADKGPNATTNYKNSLQEIMQAKGLNLPTYKVEQTGPSHAPSFTAYAKVVVNGQEIISEPAIAATRKEAEQLAAANLLDRVGNVGRERAANKPVKVDQGNYIGALQTIVQRRKWPLPRYEDSQVGRAGEGFTTRLTVVTDRGPVSVKGVGNTKKEAQQKAAESAFKLLSE